MTDRCPETPHGIVQFLIDAVLTGNDAEIAEAAEQAEEAIRDYARPFRM